MTLQVPTLAYDRAANREGISVFRSADCYQVMTPQLGSWKLLSWWWTAGIVLLTFYTAAPSLIALKERRPIAPEEIGLTAEFAALLAFVIVAAFFKLRHRYIFELTGDQLTVTRIAFGWLQRTWKCRRDAVTDIHAGADPGQLIIRATGYEMMSFMFSKNRALAEQVASALNDGLRNVARPTDALPPMVPEISPRTRRALLGAAAALVGVGAILGICVHPAAAIAPCILTIIPIGIALGTQPKKFWL